MTVKIESRSAEIDTERCVQMSGQGRYDLILAASQRLREMKRQARDSGRHVTAIDPLLEAQQGLLNMADYLAKVK